jgi:hypothetical protein
VALKSHCLRFLQLLEMGLAFPSPGLSLHKNLIGALVGVWHGDDVLRRDGCASRLRSGEFNLSLDEW